MAVALRFDLAADGKPYPVCAHHARGDVVHMVPLADVIAAVEDGAAMTP